MRKVNGALCFRLLQGPGFIVVSQELAEELMKQERAQILLQPTEEYEGTGDLLYSAIFMKA